MPTTIPDLQTWLITLCTSAVTAIGGFVLAIVNRGPAMQGAMNEFTKTLLDQDQDRMTQMNAAIGSLSARVDALAAKNVEALSEINLLRQAVELLVKHISALEVLLRAKNVVPPPRPDIPSA
jgi:hypothetical protein